MKLALLYYSQLTVNDRSADKQSGVNLVNVALLSPAYPPPLPRTSGERERSAATNASDLVGMSVCMTNASISQAGRRQAASNSVIWYCHQHPQLVACKKVRVAHTGLPSVGFRSWSRFFAVSLQVMWVINPAVGCHYFPPGLQLPPQPLTLNFAAWWTEAQWVWTVCLRLSPDIVATAIWTRALLRMSPAR